MFFFLILIHGHSRGCLTCNMQQLTHHTHNRLHRIHVCTVFPKLQVRGLTTVEVKDEGEALAQYFMGEQVRAHVCNPALTKLIWVSNLKWLIKFYLILENPSVFPPPPQGKGWTKSNIMSGIHEQSMLIFAGSWTVSSVFGSTDELSFCDSHIYIYELYNTTCTV